MPSINQRSNKNKTFTFACDESVYIVRRKNQVGLARRDVKDVICSIVPAINGFYLFKDNHNSDSQISVNGIPVLSFTNLSGPQALIKIRNQISDTKYEFIINIDNQIKRKATSLSCGYCWAAFGKDEDVVVIDGDEFHERCAHELQKPRQ